MIISSRLQLGDCLGRNVIARDDVNNVRDPKHVLHQEWQRIHMQAVGIVITSLKNAVKQL